MVEHIIESILNELYGKIVYVLTYKENKIPPKKIKGVISKNTKMGEKQFRITWFSEDLTKNVHVDLDEEEVKELLTTRKFPSEVINRLNSKYQNNTDPEINDLLGNKYTLIIP